MNNILGEINTKENAKDFKLYIKNKAKEYKKNEILSLSYNFFNDKD